MAEANEKKSVRITLLDSGLTPPVFILASFTSPAWEPHEMNHAGVEEVVRDNPKLRRAVYTFWRRFDIDPGVWKYRFRVGLRNWLIFDHKAEAGREFDTQTLKP